MYGLPNTSHRQCPPAHRPAGDGSIRGVAVDSGSTTLVRSTSYCRIMDVRRHHVAMLPLIWNMNLSNGLRLS
mgnify:FL=1